MENQIVDQMEHEIETGCVEVMVSLVMGIL